MLSQQSMRCSLCNRDYESFNLRKSPMAGNGQDVLCQACWQVLCPQPWPTGDGSAHGGINGTMQTRNSADPSTFQFTREQQAVSLGNGHGAPKLQRRSQSIPVFPVSGHPPSMAPMAAGPRPSHWQPASMPETQAVLLSQSGEGDPRWNILGGSSAPIQPRVLSASAAPAYGHKPPSFSPLELRNMMDEESLELFESQSHLLDPESRMALQRQRQYLQWQNSMDEPGPMQSVLERQESAGSGCNVPICHPDENGGDGVMSMPTPAPTVDGLTKEMEAMRVQVATAAREREVLLGRIQELERELDAHRDAARCKICRRGARNCVVLPCLHFTCCDSCFKRHCSTAPRCPECNNGVTGFQTLLMM